MKFKVCAVTSNGLGEFSDILEIVALDYEDPALADDTILCTREFVDCSRLGGYDPVDPCQHTCMFTSRDEYEGWQQIEVQCTSRPVDCSDKGGPDPLDRCGTTCLGLEP